jgi:hypothetical protein
VDEIKSGLNALLAYIDDPRPSKIIEARTSRTTATAPRRAASGRSTSAARSTGSRRSRQLEPRGERKPLPRRALGLRLGA